MVEILATVFPPLVPNITFRSTMLHDSRAGIQKSRPVASLSECSGAYLAFQVLASSLLASCISLPNSSSPSHPYK